MNRNHPYFMKQEYTPAPEDFDNLPFEVPAEKITPPVVPESSIIPPYQPKVLDLRHPMWVENYGDVNKLRDSFNNHFYNKNAGYLIDQAGCVYDPVNLQEARGGIISAMACASNEDRSEADYSFVHIMNTEDGGLRYVRCAENGTTIDLGPVEHVCIMGNVKRAEGLYIPLSNTKAMADGAIFLDNFIKDTTENDKDLHPYEKDVLEPAVMDLSNGVVHEHHKCNCSGNCKCHK